MAYNLETASKVAYLLTQGSDKDANLRLLRLALEAVASREEVKLARNLPGIIESVDTVFEFFIELSKSKDGNFSFAETLTDEKIKVLLKSLELVAQSKIVLSDLRVMPDPNVKQYVENTLPDLRQIISHENLARLRQEGLAAGK